MGSIEPQALVAKRQQMTDRIQALEEDTFHAYSKGGSGLQGSDHGSPRTRYELQ